MRMRFEVSLESCGEVDFKALVQKEKENAVEAQVEKSAEDIVINEEKKEDETMQDMTEDQPFSNGEVLNGSIGSGNTLNSSRFNIIERLEKRYGKGGLLNLKDTVIPKRVDHDDLYDSDDSFIDDSELHVSIEEAYDQHKITTKHSGFFVNAGDQIETVALGEDGTGGLSDDDDDDRRALERPKKRGKKTAEESTRAVKEFLEEWGDAATEWQPGQAVEIELNNFKQIALECTSK